MSQKELARLLEVSPQLLSRATKQGRLSRDENRLYDLTNPTNRAYLRASFHRQYLDFEGQIEEEESEKRSQEIQNQERLERTEHWRIRNSKARGELVPIRVAVLWAGAFATGLRTNILLIGERIARGDKKMRQRIEAELEKGIKKTLDTAEAEARQQINEEMKEEDSQ